MQYKKYFSILVSTLFIFTIFSINVYAGFNGDPEITDVKGDAFGYLDIDSVWFHEDESNPDILFVSKNITTLSNNWNFISLPFNQTVNKTDIIVNYAGTDYTWSQAVTNGYVSDYVFGWDRNGQYYNFADTLMPGYAYWVYSYQPCILKRTI